MPTSYYVFWIASTTVGALCFAGGCWFVYRKTRQPDKPRPSGTLMQLKQSFITGRPGPLTLTFDGSKTAKIEVDEMGCFEWTPRDFPIGFFANRAEAKH